MEIQKFSQESLRTINNHSFNFPWAQVTNDQSDIGSSESYNDYNLKIFSSEDGISSSNVNDNISLIDDCKNTLNTTLEDLPMDMQFHTPQIVSITVYSILFVFSAIGNLTVLSMLLRRRQKTRQLSPTIDLMLLNLTAADLIVTFLMMPLEIVWAATVYWRAGDFMCRIMSFFRIFGLFLSSFVIVCLAIDRFMAVKYPLHVLGGLKRSRYMIAFCWLLSILCSLPQISFYSFDSLPFFGMLSVNVNLQNLSLGNSVFVFRIESHPKFPWYTQCYASMTPEYQIAYFLFGMFFMYLGPFIFIVVLYCGIVIELIRRHRECSHELQNRNGEGMRRSGMGNIGKAKDKALKMTVLIAAIFLICWTPYYFCCLWYWIDKASFFRNVHPITQKALFLFACTNSTANPIFYGIFHLKPSFRRSHETVRVRQGIYGEAIRTTIEARSLISNSSGQTQSYQFHSRALHSNSFPSKAFSSQALTIEKKTANGHSKKNGTSESLTYTESYV